MIMVGDLLAVLRLRDEMSPALASAAKDLKSFGSTMSTVGLGLTAAVSLPIVAVAGSLIKMGMAAIESENLVAVSFGSMKDKAQEWSAHLSASLGLNQFELRKTAGTLYNMTTSMGLSKDAAFAMSTGIVELAADMASFRNIPMEEALAKIRSGLVGEAEPLKAIGILVGDATIKTYAYAHGIAKQGAELTEQQKVLARYGAILQQTSNDQGDLARTLDSPTNQLRLMRTRLEEAATSMGVSLMPAVTQVVGAISKLVPIVQGAVNWFVALPAPVRGTALAVAALAAAIGPVLILVGMTATAIGGLLPLLVGMGVTAAGTAVAVGLLGTALGVATAALAGWTAGSMIEKTTIGRELSDSFQYAALRVKGYSSAQADAMIATDHITEAARKQVAVEKARTAATVTVTAATGDVMKAEAARLVGLAAETAKTAEAVAAQKAYAAALKAARDELRAALSGANAQKSAVLWMDVLGNMKTGTTLAASEMATLAGIIDEVTLKFGSLEAAGVGGLRRIAIASSGLSKSELAKLIPDIGAGFFAQGLTDFERLQAKLGNSGMMLDDLRSIADTTGPQGFFGQGAAQPHALLKENLKGAITWTDVITPPGPGFFKKVFGSASFGADFSKTILSAIQGGGSPLKAATGFAGQSIASGIVGGFAPAFASTFLGSTLSAVLPGIGALAGPIMEKLVGSLDRNKGRDLVVDFAKSMGGFEELQKRLNSLGAEGARISALGTKIGRNNTTQAKAWIEEVTAALAEQDAAIANTKTEVSGLIQTHLGAKYPITDALQAQIDKLIEMKVITAENAAEILGLATTAVPSFADVKSAVDLLGVSIDGIGANISWMAFTERITPLIGAFETLELAGADMAAVLEQSVGKIQPLLDEALRFGKQIPEEMRPWLQRMVDASLLVDENGDKLLDLSRLEFAEPMSKKFDDLIVKIGELIEAITGGIGGALDDIGRRVVSPRISPQFDTPDFDSQPGYGGAQATGGDYLVKRPTYFLAGEAGAERATFTPMGQSQSNEQQKYLLPVTLVLPNGDVLLKAVVEAASEAGYGS